MNQCRNLTNLNLHINLLRDQYNSVFLSIIRQQGNNLLVISLNGGDYIYKIIT